MFAVRKYLRVLTLILQNLADSQKLVFRQILELAVVLQNISKEDLGLEMGQHFPLGDLNTVDILVLSIVDGKNRSLGDTLSSGVFLVLKFVVYFL